MCDSVRVCAVGWLVRFALHGTSKRILGVIAFEYMDCVYSREIRWQTKRSGARDTVDDQFKCHFKTHRDKNKDFVRIKLGMKLLETFRIYAQMHYTHLSFV